MQCGGAPCSCAYSERPPAPTWCLSWQQGAQAAFKLPCPAREPEGHCRECSKPWCSGWDQSQHSLTTEKAEAFVAQPGVMYWFSCLLWVSPQPMDAHCVLCVRFGGSGWSANTGPASSPTFHTSQKAGAVQGPRLLRARLFFWWLQVWALCLPLIRNDGRIGKVMI